LQLTTQHFCAIAYLLCQLRQQHISLFIPRLFNEAVSSPDYTAPDGEVISEL
jgi:hypothetical protein